MLFIHHKKGGSLLKKKTPYKNLFICSIILGILISLQFKVLNIANNGMTTSKKGQELSIELKRLKKEEEELNIEIKSIKDNIDRYKKSKGNSALKEELKEYETLAGYNSVEGEGIEIIIEDNEVSQSGYSNMVYNYDLFLSMINKLNSAQANAISINGERIVNESYFTIKQDKLYLNNTMIEEPFIIKAIGNSDTLASAIQIKYGIVWEMEKYYNVKVDVQKKKDIKVNGYNKLNKNKKI